MLQSEFTYDAVGSNTVNHRRWLSHTQRSKTHVSQKAWSTRSHPEMVGDMSRVTLNFDLSNIPFVQF